MPQRVKLVEAYAKAQGLWRDDSTPDPVFTDTLELDLGTVEPSLAGPRRPQDRVALSGAAKSFAAELPKLAGRRAMRPKPAPVPVAGSELRAEGRRRGDRRHHRPAPTPPTPA